MKATKLYHIVWTTYNEYPVWDKRGNWQQLAETYQLFKNKEIYHTLTHRLQNEYSGGKTLSKVILDQDAREIIKASINELCTENKDRIISGAILKMLKITETQVEIILLSNSDNISQIVARIKSKSSSLLHNKRTDCFINNHLWGKGFWMATFFDDLEQIMAMIKK